MKKRFISFISMLVAFVMCFALVACGDDGAGNNGGNGGTGGEITGPTVTAAEAANAVKELITSDGYSAKFSVNIKSDNTGESIYAVDVKKLGSRIMIPVSATENAVIDLETGYVYSVSDSGATYMHVIPQGFTAYLAGFLDANGVEFDLADIMPEYDAATKSMTYELDFANAVNTVTKPFYDAVKFDKTVGALLDDYVSLLTDGQLNFGNLLVMLDMLVEESKDQTIAETIAAIKQFAQMSGIGELTELLDSIPQDFLQAYGDRKIGEIMIGLYDYFTAMMPTESTAEDETVPPVSGDGDADIGMQTFIEGLINAALNSEVDMSTFDAKYSEIKNLIEIALDYKVKALVLPMLEDVPELKAFVENGVKLEKFGGEYTLKFDDNKKLTEFALELGITHDYKGETQGFTFLADNHYSIEFGFTVDWTKPDAEDFEFEFVPETEQFVDTMVTGVAHVSANNLSIMLETGGVEIENFEIGSSALYSPSGAILSTIENDSIAFDKETGKIVLNNLQPTGSSAAEIPAGSNIVVNIRYWAGDTQYRVVVNVLLLDNDPENVLNTLTELLEKILGQGSAPDGPTTDEGTVAPMPDDDQVESGAEA